MLVVSAVLAPATAAHATPTAVSVAGGPLAVAGPEVHNVAVVNLEGAVQVVEAPMDAFWLTDARGSGQGWVVHLHATSLREWDGTAYVAGGKALPDGSLTLPGLSVMADATDSTVPSVVAGAYHLDGPPEGRGGSGGDGHGPVLVHAHRSAPDRGTAHAYARTYRSELSVTVSSGP